ncbi:hypothetical protein SLE2022_134670 [Rubroshorea leprosula]
MENPLRRKTPNRSKQKIRKPVKVVYISNPMKVKICASKFRSLVQELTGQDAEFPDPTKFADADAVGRNQTVPDEALLKDDDHGVVVPTAPEALQGKAAEREDDAGLDDDFSAQLLENFAPSFYHEPAYIDIPKGW